MSLMPILCVTPVHLSKGGREAFADARQKTYGMHVPQPPRNPRRMNQQNSAPSPTDIVRMVARVTDIPSSTSREVHNILSKGVALEDLVGAKAVPKVGRSIKH